MEHQNWRFLNLGFGSPPHGGVLWGQGLPHILNPQLPFPTFEEKVC